MVWILHMYRYRKWPHPGWPRHYGRWSQLRWVPPRRGRQRSRRQAEVTPRRHEPRRGRDGGCCVITVVRRAEVVPDRDATGMEIDILRDPIHKVILNYRACNVNGLDP
jgi:hypothetical protein